MHFLHPYCLHTLVQVLSTTIPVLPVPVSILYIQIQFPQNQWALDAFTIRSTFLSIVHKALHNLSLAYCYNFISCHSSFIPTLNPSCSPISFHVPCLIVSGPLDNVAGSNKFSHSKSSSFSVYDKIQLILQNSVHVSS